jgi:prepilin-type N-terminal cleavage/methylation domain-containing protein
MRPGLPVSSNPRAGFTLIELMVAILILVVGVLGLASVMASVTARQTLSTAVTEVTTLAESKLEELRGYAVLKSADTSEVTMGGSLTTSVTNHADTAVSPVGRQFVLRWLVEPGPADARKVTLRVAATQDGPHTPRAMDFETLLLVIK